MTKKAFDKIAAGLEDALAYVEDADLSRYRVHVPADVDVKAIRTGLKMSQERFANAFGLPLGTLLDWEQGRERPDTAARAYLLVIARIPREVEQALQSRAA